MYKAKVMLKSALAVLVLMLAAGRGAGARERKRKVAADTPQTHVVLVGINDYADKQIKPRKFAEEDAKALYDLFVDKRYLGVPDDHIRLLLGNPDEKRHRPP